MKTSVYIAVLFLITALKIQAQSYQIRKTPEKTFSLSDLIAADTSSGTIKSLLLTTDASEEESESKKKTTQFGFGGNDLNGQIYTELINDYFMSKNNKYIGEMAFGSVVSNSESDTAKTINNFFNGGGNFFLRYSYIKKMGEADGNFSFRSVSNIRTSANLPSKNSEEPITDWNLEFSQELILSIATVNDKIEILARPKAAIAFGNKEFLQKFLSLDSKSKAITFAYFQMNFGLRITDKYLINTTFRPLVTGKFNDNFADKKWSTIGVQMLF